ncbi:MAG: reverse transcriptase family protein [Oscillospiraceae bacterium]
MPPFSTSDHVVIDFSVFIPGSKQNQNYIPSAVSGCDSKTSFVVYDWTSADYNAINDQLKSFNWYELFGFNFNVDAIWEKFKLILWPIIDCFVPKKNIPHHKKYKPRFYPKHIRNLLNRKAAIWRTLKNNFSPDTKIRYHQISNLCKEAIRNFDADRESKLLDSNNLGAFYKFVNQKCSSSSGVAPLRGSGDTLLTDDLDKANLLNSYFNSVFIIDDGKLPHFPSRFQPGPHKTLSDIDISPTIISRTLGNLKTNSAAGPDKLPPIFFRKTSSSLSYPLSIIFRTFFDLHELPAEWKTSIITPKFKKGSPSDPANYRPISLTCSCCKIMERLIAAEVIDFLNTHKLITKHQHGFLKRHSTSTNLLESLNDWTISIAHKQPVVVAYINFQRAFDSISHSKLLHKLISYGIDGDLLFWIESFLSKRTHSVRVGSKLSNFLPVTSGVPQGSVLGPLLFNLFINDITDCLDNAVIAKLFADDIKLYTEVSLPNSKTNFQFHLNLISKWSSTWQISISHSKCSVLQIGKHPDTNSYSLSDVTINHTDIATDLGVSM